MPERKLEVIDIVSKGVKPFTVANTETRNSVYGIPQNQSSNSQDFKQIFLSQTNAFKKGNNAQIAKKILKKAAINDDEKDGGIKWLRVLGWVLWSFGILAMIGALILGTSILGGFLLAMVGILFTIVGKKKKTSDKKNEDNKSELVDVVYLKNGGVIRGMIIEQVPGVSIKIKTKDGNVFVYKMEEVEKMTKEESK